MSVTELLTSTAKKLLDEARLCLDDANFYLSMSKCLPRLIPSPDEISTGDHATTVPEFVYRLDPDEPAESLRIQIALAFGAPNWWGVYNKSDGTFEIRAEASRGLHRFRLRILNVFSATYCFNPYRTAGDLIIGTVKSRHFQPLSITREDMPASLLVMRAHASNLAIPKLVADANTLRESALIIHRMGLDDGTTDSV